MAPNRSRAPRPSSRFTRALSREAEQVDGKLHRALSRRDRIAAELADADAHVAALRDRLQTLRRLGATVPDPPPPPAPPSGMLLQGAEIRVVAVAVMVERGPASRRLHYKAWLRLLEQTGYAVGGKDPAATLLTQLMRSPAVRPCQEAGWYEVDRNAPVHLRRQLDALRAELVSATTAEASDDRDRLAAEVRHAERRLGEAQAVLGAATDDSAPAPHISLA